MCIECEFCHKILSCSRSLKVHQANTKACLELQQKIVLIQFICIFCEKSLSSQQSLNNHINICKSMNIRVRKEFDDIKKVVKEQAISLEEKDREINRLTVLFKEVILKPTIINNYSKDEEISEQQTVTTIEPTFEETPVTPLDLEEGYVLEHRKEDDYINVTSLFRTEDKKINIWNLLDKSKIFLYDTSISTKIPIDKLIQYCKLVWVHPQVAVNIAQWVSPTFESKVSRWIHQILTAGKSDLAKKNKQLEQVIKIKENRIKLLQDKYCKHQPRVQYEDKFVIYIVIPIGLKKEGVYTLGKASDLTDRLSVYNKSVEHEVIFFISCGDEKTMGLVEDMTFKKLEKYKQQANRERFILPKGETIELFSNAIKECLEFIKTRRTCSE